jgi:hypothetical protein
MKCPSLHVAFRAMATAGIYGHRPAGCSSAPFNKFGGFSLPAESVTFLAEKYGWQEIVIDLNDVDIFRPDTGYAVNLLSIDPASIH